MRVRRFLYVAVVAAFAIVFDVSSFAQAAPPATKPAPAAQAPAPTPRIPGMGAPNPQLETKEPEVPDTAAIITIEGFCQTPGSTPCQTTITKADFEKLMHALDPKMPPQGRQQLADNYTKILVMAGDARKHNIDKEPRTQEVMKYIQNQVLANLYNQQLQEQAKEVPAAEVDKYYNEHKTDFDEAALRRIYIPKNVPADAKKLSDADRAALAADIDKRAKAGEDFNKLQQEVFDKLGIKSSPPPTDMGVQRRKGSMTPEESAAVFALSPGQVTDVVSTQAGDFIYKVASKQTLSVDQVRTEIQAALQRDRYTNQLSGVFAPVSVKLNPDYFGPNAAVSLPGRSPEAPAPPQPKPATPQAAKPPAN
jgi:hypothetical protein